MAAGLLTARLGPSAGVDIEVASAGFHPPDEPVVPEAARVMSEIGIDIAGHRSRAVTPQLLAASELVVTMTAAQAVEALAAVSEGWPRVYPVAELVRRGSRYGGPAPGEDLRTWLSRLAVDRGPAQLLAGRSGDIRDPTGGPLRNYRRTRDVLSAAVDPLAGWLSAAAANRVGGGLNE
jgi:protein-tyrosine-phosphatase